MENVIKTRLQSVQFAEVQIYRNIAIVPLIAPADGAFQYRTLGEALAASDIAITEVSTAGSVPDLLVVNRANKAVLLVDGEELAGAKQNRVLNSSILLKERSETTIPVSCTEQGRWAYASQAFSESGNVMAYKSRSRKTRSVQRSLEASEGHKSDQGEVWHSIAELQVNACAPSPTSAMSDVYKAREADLRKCDEIFRPVANQVGLLAFIGGAPVGADMVSLIGAYARLHPKLVRSYTLEGLLDSRPATPGSQPEDWTARARQFLDEIAATEERRFPSVGHGADFRYRSRSGPSTPDPLSGAAPVKPDQPAAAADPAHARLSGSATICGAALVHENEVIHAAFFRLDDPEQSDMMAPLSTRRRRYR